MAAVALGLRTIRTVAPSLQLCTLPCLQDSSNGSGLLDREKSINCSLEGRHGRIHTCLCMRKTKTPFSFLPYGSLLFTGLLLKRVCNILNT